jgi:hypothetical protein
MCSFNTQLSALDWVVYEARFVAAILPLPAIRVILLCPLSAFYVVLTHVQSLYALLLVSNNALSSTVGFGLVWKLKYPTSTLFKLLGTGCRKRACTDRETG